MKTTIEKINGKNKIVVKHKSQSFILDFEGNKKELKFFKSMFDKMIMTYRNDLLDEYNNFLLKECYCDTDIICEQPTALDRFLILEK